MKETRFVKPIVFIKPIVREIRARAQAGEREKIIKLRLPAITLSYGMWVAESRFYKLKVSKKREAMLEGKKRTTIMAASCIALNAALSSRLDRWRIDGTDRRIDGWMNGWPGPLDERTNVLALSITRRARATDKKRA